MNTSKSVLILLLLVVFTGTAYPFTGFHRSLNDRPWGAETVHDPVRAGAESQRFELRPGDCAEQPGWSDCQNDRERSEFSQQKPYIQIGEEVWVSWSIYLDPNWPDITPVTTTLGQFHHRDSTTPAVLFVQRNGQYSLRIESARALWPNQYVFNIMPIDRMKGKWTDIVVQAVFRPDDQGIIKVWANGNLVVNLQGPTTIGTTPIFFKYGIYRSFVSRKPDRGTHILYWDEVRSGPTRESVDPRINPNLGPVN